jgi:hypothetical protein
MDKCQCNLDHEPLHPQHIKDGMCQHCKIIEDPIIPVFRLRGQELVHESIDHLITGESNDRIWRCSQQICSTTSVEASNSLLLEHLLYAISYTSVPSTM